jgi:hypothetical protein
MSRSGSCEKIGFESPDSPGTARAEENSAYAAGNRTKSVDVGCDLIAVWISEPRRCAAGAHRAHAIRQELRGAEDASEV